MAENAKQIRQKRGKYYEKWCKGMLLYAQRLKRGKK